MVQRNKINAQVWANVRLGDWQYALIPQPVAEKSSPVKQLVRCKR